MNGITFETIFVADYIYLLLLFSFFLSFFLYLFISFSSQQKKNLHVSFLVAFMFVLNFGKQSKSINRKIDL